MLEKSRNLVVDSVAYDLEDSVTSSRKVEAREMLSRFLQQPRAQGISEQAVRINGVGTGLALDDLAHVLKSPNIDAVIVPKVNSASDLRFVDNVIRHTLPKRHASAQTTPGSSQKTSSSPGHIKILALIESAKAIIDLSEICKASPYLSGLIFAAEDFALDLSLTRTPSLTEFLYARSAIVTAARAYNLPSTIDLVCTSYRGDEGLRTLEDECEGGKALGFQGKQVIHPNQIEIVQRTFAPSHEEIEWAVRLLVADQKAVQQGKGAWTMDGEMIDSPVVGKARSIISKATGCGFNVDSLKQKWKHEQPE